MSIVIDGTGTISGVSATGLSAAQTVTSVPSSALPAGSVLQVVSNIVQTNTTYFSTGSTSFVSTGFSVTITPKFATSKILLLHNVICENPYNNLSIGLTIYRGSTNLATGTSKSVLGGIRPQDTYIDMNVPLQFVDSPATTSATTYTVYIYASGGSAYYGINPGNAGSNVLSFIAMEIAA